MTETTEVITKQDVKRESKDSSKILNVSLRGWITLMITATVCIMSIYDINVKEPMYTLVGMVVGYYFAQNKNSNDGHKQ